MGMGGGVRVGPRGMDARVDDKGRRVDRVIALDDSALMIAADQVRDLDLAEMDAERIDPERVEGLRVARGDVPRDPLVEAEFREQPEARRESLLAMQPLVRWIVEFRRRRQFSHQRRRIDRSLGLNVHSDPPEILIVPSTITPAAARVSTMMGREAAAEPALDHVATFAKPLIHPSTHAERGQRGLADGPTAP